MQRWQERGTLLHLDPTVYDESNLFTSQCDACRKQAVWVEEKLIYPHSETRIPNPDMSNDIAEFYTEASSIARLSARAAAAMLRTVLDKICIELGYREGLSRSIGKMLEEGKIDKGLQEAMDITRVIGNEALHEGKITIRDDYETVNTLFMIIDVIADDQFSKPKRISQVYESLPEEKRKGIEQRDEVGKKQTDKYSDCRVDRNCG